MKAQFPASTALIMMTVDTLLYSLLFLYMEEVMPACEGYMRDRCPPDSA